MLHTYLICSMEPDQYEYENAHADSYEQDEWYYQNPLSNAKEEDDEEYDMEEEPDWFFGENNEDGYYEPKNEI